MTVYCRFGTALDILTGKWKSLILLRLLSNGTMRFSELQKAIPDISKKMLTQQLKELEYHDIVHREVYAQIPPKVEYSITEYGQAHETCAPDNEQLASRPYEAYGEAVRRRRRKRSTSIRTSENRFLGG